MNTTLDTLVRRLRTKVNPPVTMDEAADIIEDLARALEIAKASIAEQKALVELSGDLHTKAMGRISDLVQTIREWQSAAKDAQAVAKEGGDA